MNKPSLSIIVPIYNAEAYLHACIRTVLQQTFINFELILINDGSFDQSGGICDEYAKKDNRVVVIHKVNGGVSAARNAGLDIAQGNYITFIDSDDEYGSPSIIEENMQILLEDTSIAIVQFPVKYISGNCDLLIKYNPQEKVLLIGEEDYLRSILTDSTSLYIWNKIYKKSFFNIHKFLIQINAEDTTFNLQISEHVQKMVLNNRSFYNYYERDGSITHTNGTSPIRLVNEIKSMVLMFTKAAKYKSLSKSYIIKYSHWLSYCHKTSTEHDISGATAELYRVHPSFKYLLTNLFSQPKAIAYIAVHLLFKNNKKGLEYLLQMIKKDV